MGWSELQALFHEKRIDSTTYVFADSLPDWTPASHIDLSGREPQSDPMALS